MNEENLRKILEDDALFDEYIRQALIDDLERELDETEEELKDDPPYEFSEEFEERMAKVMGIPVRELQKPRKKRRRKRAFKAWLADNTVKVATILAAFLVGGVTFQVFNPEVRAAVATFVTHMFDDHSVLETSTTNNFIHVGTKYSMTCVPRGYEVASADTAASRTTYVFQNSSSRTEFNLTVKDGSADNSKLYYDVDYTEATYIEINGNEGRLFETNRDSNALFWVIGTDSFMIAGQLSPEVMVEVAEGIVLDEDANNTTE